MIKTKDENFNLEQILNDLNLASPIVSSIMFCVRNKKNKEAEKTLVEEGVSKEDAKKIIAYLYKKYCSEIEIVPIRVEDVDRNDVVKLDMDDYSDVALYLVKHGDILQKAHLFESYRGKNGLVFYLDRQPELPLEKVEQLWKIVRKT